MPDSPTDFAKKMLQATKSYVLRAVGSVSARVEALEKRVVELEQAPKVKFCGTYRADASYAEGSLVVDRGATWICRRATTERPGDGSADWTLTAKSHAR